MGSCIVSELKVWSWLWAFLCNFRFVPNTNISIPTHYFIVLTCCKNPGQSVSACSDKLQTVSFLIPHRPDNMEICKVSYKKKPNSGEFWSLFLFLLVSFVNKPLGQRKWNRIIPIQRDSSKQKAFFVCMFMVCWKSLRGVTWTRNKSSYFVQKLKVFHFFQSPEQNNSRLCFLVLIRFCSVPKPEQERDWRLKTLLLAGSDCFT